jgi:CHAT domain-containing protein
MSKQHFPIRRFLLMAFFILGFVICFLLGYSPLGLTVESAASPQEQGTRADIGATNLEISQILDSALIVQQGVEKYQQGLYQEAIDLWERALPHYAGDERPREQAVILENLARAYQTIGKVGSTPGAIDYWDRAVKAYQHMRDRQQEGRMLTELAQAHILVGQHRYAVELLCNGIAVDANGDRSDEILPCVKDSALRIAEDQVDRVGEAAALGSLGEAYRLLGSDHQANCYPTGNLPIGVTQEEEQEGEKDLECYFKKSLELAQELQNLDYEIAALNSWGNGYVGQALINYRKAAYKSGIRDTDKANEYKKKGFDSDQRALQYFEESFRKSSSSNNASSQIRSILASIPVHYRVAAYYRGNELDENVSEEELLMAKSRTKDVMDLLEDSPASSSKVYVAITLSRLLKLKSIPHPSLTDINQSLLPIQCLDSETPPQAFSILNQAILDARQIKDERAESFALGELGHLYECMKQPEAMNFTLEARQKADQEKDSLYLWEWQTARLLKKQNKQADSIKAYELAIKTLEESRRKILNAKQDFQFDFRDVIEPLYRESIDLRLSQPHNSSGLPISDEDKGNRITALETIDLLRLAELQNYFSDDCRLVPLDLDPKQIRKAEQIVRGSTPNTAIFSSIIFDKRTVILVQYANGEPEFTQIEENKETVIDHINEFRKNLDTDGEGYNLSVDTSAQWLYQKIIDPFSERLQKSKVTTLVFLQDGFFRSIPMSALNNGKEFLIEKYAIAILPRQTLRNPSPIKRNHLRVLAMASTQGSKKLGLPPLPKTEEEVQKIREFFPRTKLLIDQGRENYEEFSEDNLESELKRGKYSVVHMATHGEFGIDSQSAFLLTGDSQQITIEDFSKMFQIASPEDPIELISLLACYTGEGSDRAVLGLAGVAAQTGAKRVLASLWTADEGASFELVSEFYKNLGYPGINTAQVLQKAQKLLLKSEDYNHPRFWAPFILIGDWQ